MVKIIDFLTLYLLVKSLRVYITNYTLLYLQAPL